jgi:opacity protein-like surface antigen
MEFDLTTVQVERFTSPNASLVYELSTANQTNSANNNAVALFVNHNKYFAVHGRFSADYKLGFGGMHMEHIVPGQSTATNFNEQVGLGLQYAITKNSAITLDSVFYHASNAHTCHPNHGINATAFTVGYCWHR